ncbi:MAG: acyltransferase [Proteobacteria bacterium]|nr:acyltransferase [Pseudomonadota bacterium]
MSNASRAAEHAHAGSELKYRPDIDGLRALAVLGVLAYHFGLGVPGGYGGVDVFFVISGFLIAGIIKAELEADTFSLANFYVRRIRRILPALAACLFVTTAAASVILFPRDFQNFGRTVLAAATSTSNFFFMNRTGYFDDAAIEKPLLHTWSLGVEEQFYVVFPLTLMLLFRFWRASVLYVLGAVVVLSFAYGCYAVNHAPEKAFFSTTGRAWELGIGVLVAFGILPTISRRLGREIEAGIGLLLILGAYIFYGDGTPFPGIAALPLCLGAAMIIHSGTGPTRTIVARALSAAPMVGVGLISYSVYLWHWPLLVLSVYRFPNVFDAHAPYATTAHMLLAGASLFIGAISWALVEKPFRRVKAGPRDVFVAGAVATLSIAVLASVVIVRPGWLQNWGAEIEAMQFKRVVPVRSLGLARAEGWIPGTYSTNTAASVPDTMLWGDSFAEALTPGFVDYQKKTGHGIILSAVAGCPPLPGVTFHQRGGGKLCTSRNANILKLIGASKIRRVILVARWSVFAKTMVRDASGHPTVYGNQEGGDGSVLATALEAVVRQLVTQDREVVIIGPIPAQSFAVTPAVAKHVAWGLPLPAPLTFQDFTEEQRSVLSLLSRLDNIPNVRVAYPHTVLCRGDTCPYSINGIPMYSDDAHLSPEGVAKLNPLFDDIFSDGAHS